MSEEWIFRCWDFRDDVAVSANDEHLVLTSLVVSIVNAIIPVFKNLFFIKPKVMCFLSSMVFGFYLVCCIFLDKRC